jgi:oligopeptide/dipeptide ABC transporter ATP-binding protein
LNNQVLLDVNDLTISFQTEDPAVLEIIDGVSFRIHEGEIFGLVGESGCGKTITALSILKLLPQPLAKILSGTIYLKNTELVSLSFEQIKKIRGKEIGVIFQEPTAALNPLLTIENQLYELFDYHEVTINKEKRINDLLKRVGFSDPSRILSAYPHELSGGMLQRVMISLALLLNPSLIIADEPTTALDVTIQAQIMELLIEMQKELGTAILFITHNLNLIAQYADRLAVMYAGRIVEESKLKSFLQRPLHPYSQGLLAALPDLHSEHNELQSIPGQVPQPKNYISGCRFKERCKKAFEQCTEKPELIEYIDSHTIACFLYK